MAYIKHKKQNKGFALLLAIIISSVVLSIGISILNTSVNQLSLSSTARESEIAFQSAQTTMDCLRYWRYQKAEKYSNPSIGGVGTTFDPPSVVCFGKRNKPRESDGLVLYNRANRGFVVTNSYEFEWGTPRRCTSAQMSIMSPDSDSDITYTFPGTSVGDDGDGVKTCNAGTICTVLISQGYNRPCDELETSIFTVQRELTLEF